MSNFYDDLLEWIAPKPDSALQQERIDFASRQINAAYEEHAEIIESLRTEVAHMKAREKHLLKKFAETMKPFTNPDAVAALRHISSSPFDEDMPVDELTDKVRFEQRERTNADIHTRRIVEDLQKKNELVLNEKNDEIQSLRRQLLESEDHKIRLAEELKTLKFQADRQQELIASNEKNESVLSTPYNQEFSFDNLSIAIDNLLTKESGSNDSLLGAMETKIYDKVKIAFEAVEKASFIFLDKNMQRVKNESKEKDSKIAELEAKVVKLESSLRKLHQDEGKKGPEKILLLKQLLEAASKYSELEVKFQTVERERDTLRQEKKTLQEKNEENIRAIQRVLVDVSTAKDTEISQLRGKVEILSKIYVDLQREVDPSFNEKSVNSILDQSFVVIHETELKTIRSKAEKTSFLEEKLSKMSIEYEALNQNYRVDLESAKNALLLLRDENSVMKRTLAECQSINEDLASKLFFSDEELSSLREEKSTVEKSMTVYMNHLKEEIDALTKKLENTEAELTSCMEDNNMLKKKVEDVELSCIHRLHELEAANANLRQSSENLQKSQHRVSDLENQLSSAKKIEKELLLLTDSLQQDSSVEYISDDDSDSYNWDE